VTTGSGLLANCFRARFPRDRVRQLRQSGRARNGVASLTTASQARQRSTGSLKRYCRLLTIEEHKSERVYRGETSDGISFVYYPKANNGLWYTFTGKLPSVGRLGRNSLKVLGEIMAETGRL
jgi:hypothetical protein